MYNIFLSNNDRPLPFSSLNLNLYPYCYRPDLVSLGLAISIVVVVADLL